jgi:hypothetical protein
MSDDPMENKARTTAPRRFPENGFGVVESDNIDRSVLPNFNGRPNWNRRPTHLPAREQPAKPQE